MANRSWLPRIVVPSFSKDNSEKPSQQHKLRSRPLPLRVRTFSQSTSSPTTPASPADQRPGGSHFRHNSVASSPITSSSPYTGRPHASSLSSTDTGDIFDSPRNSIDSSNSDDTDPSWLYPATPLTSLPSARNSVELSLPEVQPYDFTHIDYELSRAKVLGEGLWSTVYLAEQKLSSSSPSTSPQQSRRSHSFSQPAKLRRKLHTTSTLFAVKTPSRADSTVVFRNEAKILTHLQRRSLASNHIVTFHGLDPRTSSLVFEALFGGSLESLNSRLKQMTEVARHLEIISLFPGLAVDLIGGLEFLHANGVVHADIKAGNVLLDISQHAADGRPVVRARYIDFSAAFLEGEGEGDAGKYAGGTWDYMAPEQMRPNCSPTFASDVWSLGLTLLVVLCGGSPYAPACGNNMFMLREAVKTGDAIGFAKMDPVVRKRLDAVQDLVDCCRFALKKEPEKRVTAGTWAGWVEGWTGTERDGMMA